jgi:Trefoil (P-type) domain
MFFSAEDSCLVTKPTDRIDCSYPGITKDLCIAKGCCFDSTVPNVKWCFKKGNAFGKPVS